MPKVLLISSKALGRCGRLRRHRGGGGGGGAATSAAGGSAPAPACPAAVAAALALPAGALMLELLPLCSDASNSVSKAPDRGQRGGAPGTTLLDTNGGVDDAGAAGVGERQQRRLGTFKSNMRCYIAILIFEPCNCSFQLASVV